MCIYAHFKHTISVVEIERSIASPIYYCCCSPSESCRFWELIGKGLLTLVTKNYWKKYILNSTSTEKLLQKLFISKAQRVEYKILHDIVFLSKKRKIEQRIQMKKRRSQNRVKAEIC